MVATQPVSSSQMVGGHRLAYLRAGTGEPVLLVHGIQVDEPQWLAETMAEFVGAHHG